MKNAIQNETSSFALGFGEKSKFDETTLDIYKEFSAKSTNELYKGKIPRSYFLMMKDFNKLVKALDKQFIWSKVLQMSKKTSTIDTKNFLAHKPWIAMVFGECGQGKSTTLN